MDIRMVVRSHTECQVSHMGVHCWPSLQCDYVDQLGRIQKAKFNPCDLGVLLRMNDEDELPVIPQPQSERRSRDT